MVGCLDNDWMKQKKNGILLKDQAASFQSLDPSLYIGQQQPILYFQMQS